MRLPTADSFAAPVAGPDSVDLCWRLSRPATPGCRKATPLLLWLWRRPSSLSFLVVSLASPMSSKASSLTIALASVPLFLASLRLFPSGMRLALSPVCERMPRRPRSGAARRLRQFRCTTATRQSKVKVKFLGRSWAFLGGDRLKRRGPVWIRFQKHSHRITPRQAKLQVPSCPCDGLITGRSPTVGESNHYWASWRAAIKGRLNASGRASRQSALSRGVTSLTLVGHVLAVLCRWTRFRSARQLLVPSPQAP